MKDVLHPIEETIRQYFIPAITGCNLCSDDERVLLSLPVKLGGLGISILTDSSNQEYNNSRLVTEKSTNNIINQNKTYDPLKDEIKAIKNNIKNSKLTSAERKLSDLREKLEEKRKRQNEIVQEVGCSNWLTSLPLK